MDGDGESLVKPDLELVETADLIKELAGRFSGIVFIADKMLTDGENQEAAMTFCRAGGSVAHILGLIEYGRGMIERTLDDMYEADNGEDE